MPTPPPRYVQLAEALRREIETGAHAVGALLPTEHQLCNTHGVSRHTVREALRLLDEAGLVERRRGAGTRVAAPAARAAFVQPLGGLTDLLQYARDARFLVTRSRHVLAPEEIRDALDGLADRPWLAMDGVRVANGRALAATTIYVDGDYEEAIDPKADWDGAVTALLAQRYALSFDRIAQEIAAVALSEADARAIGVEPGVPALRAIRRYYDARDRLIVASDSRHPADRFRYQMTYVRDRAGDGMRP